MHKNSTVEVLHCENNLGESEWANADFQHQLGNNGDKLTSKTLPLSTVSLQPLLHPFIFCHDNTMPPNVCFATFIFPNQLEQSSCKESKNKCLIRKHKECFLGLDRHVPSSALTAALEKEELEWFLSILRERKRTRVWRRGGRYNYNYNTYWGGFLK